VIQQPKAISGMPVLIRFDVTCEAAPLQIEGIWARWAGYEEPIQTFYFRARHHRWRLDAPYKTVIAEGEGDFSIGEAVNLISRAMTKRFE